MSQSIPVPQNQKQIIAFLLDCFSELPKQLQICARYIIDHPHEVGVQSMRTLATEASVHPNSFVRLARHLGFEGYEMMRERFRDFVRGGEGSSQDRALWLQSLAKKGGGSAIVGEMASAELDNLEQMYANQRVDRLEKAVQMMADAKTVYVMGVGSSYTLAYNFWYVSRMMYPHFVLIPRHGSLLIDDLLTVSEEDCVFGMTFQPYRTDVIEALQYARDRGAKTVGLSDSPATRVYQEADLGLFSPTHTPQFFHSNSAVTALLETLCALLAASGGEKVVNQLSKFNELRWQSGIYQE